MANNALAYGFVDLESVLGDRVTNIGERRVLDAIQETAVEHNRAMGAMMSELVEVVDIGKDLVPQLAGGEMQPLDALGIPLPVHGLPPISVGYPIQGGGTAWATDRISRAYMTGLEANKLTLEAMGRDLRTLRRRLFASVFDNVAWTFNDVALKLGDITVYPLANNDTQTYLRTGGAAPSADNHYLAQAAAISDAANPFPGIYTELTEHPGNGNEVVCYVASDLVDTVESLSEFVPVRDAFVEPAATSAQLTANVARVQGPGDAVLGRVSKCWIVEWKALPSTYIFAKAVNAGPVVAMREHVPAQLKGLIVENNSPDGNIAETRMLRFAGFGVKNRTAACVMRIGNASYAIPTGYDAPLGI